MGTWKSKGQLDNERDVYIKLLEKTIQKCMKIWGKGYEPKENVEDTIGSLLYLECQEVIIKK